VNTVKEIYGFAGPAEELLASQEGFSSIEVVTSNYTGEPVNRSQIYIKSKTCDIRT
jgi:hypothetical protein